MLVTFHEPFQGRLLKIMHCHMLNVSSFASTVAIHMSEDFSIVMQNHILCYFPSKYSMNLSSAIMPAKKVLSTACHRDFHKAVLFLCFHTSFIFYLSGCIYVLFLLLFNWKFSDARAKFMFECIQHLDPCP